MVGAPCAPPPSGGGGVDLFTNSFTFVVPGDNSTSYLNRVSVALKVANPVFHAANWHRHKMINPIIEPIKWRDFKQHASSHLFITALMLLGKKHAFLAWLFIIPHLLLGSRHRFFPWHLSFASSPTCPESNPMNIMELDVCSNICRE